MSRIPEKDKVVLYHGDGCLDGFGAATLAWMRFGDEAEYWPLSYETPLT